MILKFSVVDVHPFSAWQLKQGLADPLWFVTSSLFLFENGIFLGMILH